jgi:hypothetical protein
MVLIGSMTTLSVMTSPPELTDDPHLLAPTTELHRQLQPHDPNAAIMRHDQLVNDIVSDAPFAHITKNIAVAGRGVRLEADATTDVWVLGKYAYTGTFSEPCGGEPNAGILIWDVHDPNKVSQSGFIPSPIGSRANDVKVASLNSGDILVHTNEPCDGGAGGFEIYNVDDPNNPVFMAHVQVDEINQITDSLFGGLKDNGVHNLWLFSQGDKDYVAAQSEGVFDGFQIFEITNPAAPVLISGWGAEEVFDPDVGDETEDVNRVLDAALWMLGGFGSSQNRFLHDFTITKDSNTAYLAHWDAGLIKLDISDITNPQLISVAIDPTSEDGEVNSHSVWPNADGTIVVEGEEDFSPFETQFTIATGPNAGSYASAEGSLPCP